MLKLGLTGSIGMGKSTVAQMFRDAGVPVHDSDATVHALYSGAAAPLIETAFPGTVINGSVDRQGLGRQVLDNPVALQKLEKIVHPLVSASRNRFLAEQLASGSAIVVLDIPLLFETGAESQVDAILVVSASADIQKGRVLKRNGMTLERFEQILQKQLPDAEKRRRADEVIRTDGTLLETRSQVDSVLKRLTNSKNGPSHA